MLPRSSRSLSRLIVKRTKAHFGPIDRNLVNDREILVVRKRKETEVVPSFIFKQAAGFALLLIVIHNKTYVVVLVDQ